MRLAAVMREVSESGLNDDIEDTADLDFELTMARLSGIPCPQ
jgi:hypothetical protein